MLDIRSVEHELTSTLRWMALGQMDEAIGRFGVEVVDDLYYTSGRGGVQSGPWRPIFSALKLHSFGERCEYSCPPLQPQLCKYVAHALCYLHDPTFLPL